MANVTFTSPVMARDVTVYAVAGDRGTILAIAKANKIPIPFDCQDGECGSCLIEVKHLDPLSKLAVSLTDKEKEMLKQLGKITKAELADAEVNDLPPKHRLACQCFVRDEDIIVSFVGDGALPAAQPHTTHAAKRFKGGTEVSTPDELYSYIVKVEADAADHFAELARTMEASGAKEIVWLFDQLAKQSREQAEAAKKEAGAINSAVETPSDYVWPHYATPTAATLWASDAALSRLDGLKAALQGERRGYEFYCAVEATTKNPDVAKLVKSSIREEAEHIKVLEAWITREEFEAKSRAAAR